MNVSTRYALRSLRRSSTRTVLSLLGIAIGCAIGLLTTAWIRGEGDLFVNAAADSGTGHLQLRPNGWKESRDERLRLEGNWKSLLDRVRARPEVRAAGPHVTTQALLGMGTRVQGAALQGVDPEVEPKMVRYISGLSAGRYLKPTDEHAVVLGAELARRLDSGVGDELVASAMLPNGDIASALLTIVGIISTGSRNMDAGIAHVKLQDAMELCGRKGISNITINVKDPDHLESARRWLQDLAGKDAQALTWMDVSPELVSGLKTDEAFSNVISVVVVVLVLFGVTSAQLTGVLQRGREFSVLTAIGMQRRQIVKLVLVESLVLGVIGSIAGLILATPLIYYLATTGVDMRQFMAEGDLSIGNVLMDPVMRASMGPWLVPYGLGLGVVATLGAAGYPAWFTRRIDPANALRGRG